MENIRRPAPDIFHTSDLIYDNHMEEAFFRCNELPLPTLSYLSTGAIMMARFASRQYGNKPSTHPRALP